MENGREVSMKKIKKFLALTLAIGLTATACNSQTGTTPEDSPSGDTKKISFVLDWTPNTNHTGVYVALANGYYKDKGLDVEIIQPPEDGSIAAVGSGQAQFGVSFQENVGEAIAADAPAPITAVATIIDHNTSGIITLRDQNINSFSDLEGKTYATWGLPVEQAILKYAVESQGGDFSKVKMVPHSGADAVSLLKSGTVDAVWVYEAWDNVMADIENLDYNYVPFVEANTVLDYYTPVIIANNDFLQSEGETAKAFMEATAQGYNFAIEKPKEAADILLKAVPELDSKMVHESQDILALYYKSEKEQWGTIDPNRWEPFFDFMYGNNLIHRDLGTKGFTNDFLPKQS